MEIFDSPNFERLIIPILCTLFSFYILGSFDTVMQNLLKNLDFRFGGVNIKPEAKKKAINAIYHGTVETTEAYEIKSIFNFIGVSSLTAALVFVFYETPFIAMFVIATGNFIFTLFSKTFFSRIRVPHYIFLFFLIIVWVILDFFLIQHNIKDATLLNWLFKHYFIVSYIFPFVFFYFINNRKAKQIASDLIHSEQPNPLDYYDPLI